MEIVFKVMSRQIFDQQILPAKDKMYRFAARLLRSSSGGSEEARDVVQDALLKAWNHKERLDQINNPEAWCMQITKNLCIDRLRALKVRRKTVHQLKQTDSMVDHPKVHETDSGTIDMNQIKQLIDELPEQYRMVIHLREVEGFTYEEISEITELNLSNVKVTLYRARKKLKEQLINSNAYDTS